MIVQMDNCPLEGTQMLDSVGLKDEFGKQGRNEVEETYIPSLYTRYCNLYLVNSTNIYMYMFPFQIVFGLKDNTTLLGSLSQLMFPTEQEILWYRVWLGHKCLVN